MWDGKLHWSALPRRQVNSDTPLHLGLAYLILAFQFDTDRAVLSISRLATCFIVSLLNFLELFHDFAGIGGGISVVDGLPQSTLVTSDESVVCHPVTDQSVRYLGPMLTAVKRPRLPTICRHQRISVLVARPVGPPSNWMGEPFSVSSKACPIVVIDWLKSMLVS